MSKMIVLNVARNLMTEDVVDRLRILQQDYFIDLRDAFVAERDEYGKVHVTPAIIWWSDVESTAA